MVLIVRAVEGGGKEGGEGNCPHPSYFDDRGAFHPVNLIASSHVFVAESKLTSQHKSL